MLARYKSLTFVLKEAIPPLYWLESMVGKVQNNKQ